MSNKSSGCFHLLQNEVSKAIEIYLSVLITLPKLKALKNLKKNKNALFYNLSKFWKNALMTALFPSSFHYFLITTNSSIS